MSLEESLAVNQALKSEVSELKSENTDLKHQLAQLRKYLNGTKSERFETTDPPAGQIDLFTEQVEPEQEDQGIQKIIYERQKPKKKHPGRHPIPDHLPVRQHIVEPDFDTTNMVVIGEEVTETVGFEPGVLYKLVTIRKKYAYKDGSGIEVVGLPDRALPRSIAHESLLAYLFVSKFVDHLPFYRQRQQFKRNHQWELSSSTINDWFIACCTLLEPLYNHIVKLVLQTDYLQADESPIKVLDKQKKKLSHQGYQWVYRCGITGIVLFQYRKGRGQHGPKELLSNYEGYLQSDGYIVYDKIAKGRNIIQLGCWAHARRKFHEALSNDKTLAEKALELIKAIYMHERQSKDMDAEQKKAYRIEHVQPIMERLHHWAVEQQKKVIPKSSIAKAIEYLLNQWKKLSAILQDGRLEIDNNLIENTIRPLALGRKNYLFAGSHAAAQRIAIMYTFFATCKAKGVNPLEWMTRTLKTIRSTSIQNLDPLVPGYEIPSNQESLK